MENTGEWFRTELVSPDVRRIQEPFVHDFFSANMFHINGRDADLVVDFGMGLQSLLRYLDLDPEKPIIAVATHAHVDHVGSFHEFGTRLGHIEEDTGFSAMGDEHTLAHLFRALPEPVSRAPVTDWAPTEYRLQPAPLTQHVDEGDIVDLGNRAFRVLHLPGHSPGGIGLLDQNNGEFFSGDAIYDGGLVDDLPGCNRNAYRATMRRLASLDTSMSHGGHGNAMSPDRMREIASAYLRDFDQRG